MAEIIEDQAEGLRRLLATDFTRVITLIGGCRGIGTTTVLLNLAMTLAHQGARVLLLDEQEGAGSACLKLGLKPCHDLYEAIHQGKSLPEITLSGPAGISVVPAARMVRAISGMSGIEQHGLLELFRSLPEPYDVVLIDAHSAADHALCLSLAAQEVVLVVGSEPASITEAYAHIKVLARDFDLHRFHVLVNRVSDENEGRTVFDNMAAVARRHLGVRVELLGNVPEDGALEQAVRKGVPLAQLKPQAPGCQAIRRVAEGLQGWPRPCGDDMRLEGFARRLFQSSRLTEKNISTGILAGVRAKG